MHPLADWWAANAVEVCAERRILRDYVATLTFTIGWWHWMSSAKPVRRDRLSLRIDDHVTALRTLCAPVVEADPRLAEADREAADFLATADTATLEHEDVVRLRAPLRRALDLLDEIETELLRRP